MDNPDEVIEKLHFDNDEEWEEMMKGMNDEELIAYVRQLHAAIVADPDQFPGPTPDLLDEMLTSVENHEKAVHAANIADQQWRIAKARVESTADALLSALPDKGKGH